MVFCLFIFIFLFRSNGKKKNWMRTTFITVMVITLKITWYQLFLKFPTITRHIDNGIWKTPYSWRFYGHGPTYMLILCWTKIMKRKWATVPWKLLVAQKSEPVLWRTWHQDISLIVVFFFFSETNLVFKFNLVLIE